MRKSFLAVALIWNLKTPGEPQMSGSLQTLRRGTRALLALGIVVLMAQPVASVAQEGLIRPRGDG